ncbi:MAG: alpha/beta hydrolase [Lachnospiraceae bacterium]|nr:alpha/beta hydrolase [Lachnospiraceae bacterium]
MNTNIDGININYRDEGSGEVVLLLHGWGSNIALFDGIFNLLTPKYRVVALDMPGFGQSDEPKEVWGVDEYLDFVIKFIESLELKDFTVLGHSFGGRVIIKMVNRNNLSFKVNKIILVDSAGIKPKRTLSYHIKVKSYKAMKAILGCAPVKALFPGALEKYKKGKGSADYNAASDIMKGCLVKVVNEDLTDLLKNIKQDTLLIWGENDDATPLSDGKIMEKLIPEAGLATIKNAGHYSFLEQKYVFDKILASYMNI